MSALLFTYGTLEAAALIEMVTGATWAAEPAVLPGFARFLLLGRDYPGLVPAAGAATRGTLYHGVDDAALSRLDEFEGEWYERRLVPVRKAAGEVAAAWAYVIPDRWRHLVSTEPWDREGYLASGGFEFRRRRERLPADRQRGGEVDGLR